MYTYSEITKNNRISNDELIDGRNYRIELETDYDVLNWDAFSIDLINRFNNDGKTLTINIVGKDTSQIIKSIKNN